MEQNMPSTEDMSGKQAVMEALKRVEAESAQRRLEQDQEFPQENLEMEIPEELENPGEHSLSDMASLARIGKGNKTFEYLGNTIMVRTLNQGEELEILSRISSFPPTAQNRAYNIYAAALSLEAVNGKPYFERQPLGKNHDIINYKFNKIKELHPEVINAITDNAYQLRIEIQEKAQYAKKG